jgi:hypothetical protein
VTAQFTDLVVHDGYEFCLCGIQGESLFDPADAGLRTYATSTANYRGYIATYGTLGGRLYLDSLVVGDKATIHDRAIAVGDVVLGGTVVPASDHGEMLIAGIGVSVDFSGGLLIGKDFVEDTYVHMGFHPGWKYRWVLDARFESGELRRVINRSDVMRELREGVLAGTIRDPDGASRNESWVKRTFTLDYSRSGLV